MVNLLYAVAAITCALVILLLTVRTRRNLSRNNPLDKAFLILIDWTTMFCFADGFWGVMASDLAMNDTVLTIASFIFHFLAALTSAVWLQFILAYLGNVKKRKLYFGVTFTLIAAEVVLLILNFSNHQIFYLASDGAYHSGGLRKFLFYAQYVTYLTMAVISLVRIAESNRSRSSHIAVLAFVGAPILCGIFQLLYPDAPAYSIGYTLGCCIVYSFVVSDMIEARTRESLMNSSANKAKTTFLNNMSHDIRTPLNAIAGFNNMAMKALGKDEDKVRDCLKKIGLSSDSLLGIINDILEISRIEAGKITVAQDKGKVIYSFANIEPMMNEIARTAGIKLQFSFGKIDDMYVICDFSHCARVFTNLINNAIKYTRRGGSIHVHCEQTGRRDDGYGIYTYTFADNGIGMSEEFQKELFKPFARENTATVSGIQGSGLGLALCKNIVEALGGSITCASRQNVGSTFTVTLPFRIQEGQEFTDPTGKESQELPEFLTGKKIILVDDNELNREIASALLREMGAEVTEATDGTEVIELMKSFEASDFDLILMDIQMPVIDGYEATRQIRALGTDASRIPIIAMTANAYDDDRKAAFAVGMNGHIAKPIDLTQLSTTLHTVLKLS